MKFSKEQEPGAKKLKSQIKDFTTFERLFKVQQWLREEEEGGRRRGEERRGWRGEEREEGKRKQ